MLLLAGSDVQLCLHAAGGHPAQRHRPATTVHATTPTPCARRRLEQLLVDGGAPVEAVRAALGERGRQPALAARTAHEVKVGQGGVVAVAV